MPTVLSLLVYLIDIYIWIIIARFIGGLLQINNIIPHNQFTNTVMALLYGLTEPVLGPARRLIPPFSGVDISPLLVFLALHLLRAFLIDILI